MSEFKQMHGICEEKITNAIGAIALAFLKHVNRPDECESGTVEAAIDYAAAMTEGAFQRLWGSNFQDLKALNDQLEAHKAAIEGYQCAISDLQDELAKKNGVVHPIASLATRSAVFSLTGGTCTYCGVTLVNGGKEPDSFCVEHVVPKSCGGPDNLSNYVPSCTACNSSKSDKHVLEFVRLVLPKRLVLVEAAE